LAYFITFGRIVEYDSWEKSFLQISLSSLNQMRPSLIFNYETSSILFLIGFSVMLKIQKFRHFIHIKLTMIVGNFIFVAILNGEYCTSMKLEDENVTNIIFLILI